MSKKVTQTESSGVDLQKSKKTYKKTLHKLRVELVKLQRHFINSNDKILIIMEGRDAFGKDKRLVRPDPQIVFEYDISNLDNGRLVK